MNGNVLPDVDVFLPPLAGHVLPGELRTSAATPIAASRAPGFEPSILIN